MAGSEHALIARNLRFLLWREGLKREQWAPTLASRLGLYPSVAEQLVRGGLADTHISSVLLERINQVFGFESKEGELRFRDLVSEAGNILGHNVRYLIDSLPHGGKKKLANALGVDQTTVARWLKGTFPPSKSMQIALGARFGLPSDVDLSIDPLYLSPVPIVEGEQRRWVQHRVEELSSEQFRARYMALWLILKDE
jgi:transcriptional regulator with XRE-family HTH domain